jgi:hypothetical protein
MVSRFLTELPIKDLPEGPDRFLIEDIQGVGTKTTTFSALKEYLGITVPGGLNNLGTEVGDVNIGNSTGITGITGLSINVLPGSTFNLSNIVGRTTNINTGAGSVTTTLGNNTPSNNFIINSTSVTAPNQNINSNSSLLTRSGGDSRYGTIIDATLVADTVSITDTTYVTILTLNGLEGGFIYEISGNILVNKVVTDEDPSTVDLLLAYSGNSLDLVSVSNIGIEQQGGTSTNYFVTSSTIPSPLFSIAKDSSTQYCFVLKGVIRTTNSGTLTLQMRKGGAFPATLRALMGSYLRLRRL